jgi:hypothetical protein
MNKSTLLIAAVAASIAGAATADVSINGNFKGTAKHTFGTATSPSLDTELTTTIKGKSGSNTVVLTTKMTDGEQAVDVKEAYVASKIGGVSVKAGKMFSTKGFGLMKKTETKTKIKVTSSLAGVKITAAATPASTADASITVSGNFAGTSIKVQNVLSADRYVSVAGKLGSFDAKAEFSTGIHAVQLSTSVAGSKLTFQNLDGVNTQTKGLFGDTADKTLVRGIAASMPTALGTVTAKYSMQDDATTSEDHMSASLKAGSMTYSASKQDDDAITAKAVLSFKF